MLLDHSFEMLLKAGIVHSGHIREPGQKHTIAFDACVRRCSSDAAISFLTEEQTLTLQTINGLRDAAQHHLVELSEGHLYLQAQTGVTLFRELFKTVLDEDLSATLPARTLPISTVAQLDPIALFIEEVGEVRRLLRPHRKRAIEAEARLRALAILDDTIRGEKLQPDSGEVRGLARRLASGDAFESVFPGVAAIESTQGRRTSAPLESYQEGGYPCPPRFGGDP